MSVSLFYNLFFMTPLCLYELVYRENLPEVSSNRGRKVVIFDLLPGKVKDRGYHSMVRDILSILVDTLVSTFNISPIHFH